MSRPSASRAAVLRKRIFIAALAAATAAPAAEPAATGEPAAAPRKAAFPLKRIGRHLADQDGVPFLVAGESPQSLIVNLTEAEAELFCANRASHGFNTLWINLLCRQKTGGRANGGTWDYITPFEKPDDLAAPNEAYFARADQMLKIAARHGLCVFLDPCETIDHLEVMLSNGPEKCRAFGRFLGSRFKDADNLVWMSGNDFQTWKNLVHDEVSLAVARGIREADPRSLQTVELNYEASGSLDDERWAALIDINCSYTYYPSYAEVLKDYGQPQALPVVLIESDYEFERESTPAVLRRIEYWANLSGASGQFYGNAFTRPFKEGWQARLDTPGAVQMAWVQRLLASRPWQDLIPDSTHTLVVAGYGTFDDATTPGNHYVMTSDYVAAARTPDGRLGMAFMPSLRPLTVDLGVMAGPVAARWYDPSRGEYAPIDGSPFKNSGRQVFKPAGNNGDGDGDWVLVLESDP